MGGDGKFPENRENNREFRKFQIIGAMLIGALFGGCFVISFN
jgi:hypothetical protein